MNLGEALVFLILIPENSFSHESLCENTLNKPCLQQQSAVKGNSFRRLFQGLLTFQGFVVSALSMIFVYFIFVKQHPFPIN